MTNNWFILKRNATLHHVVPISRSIVINLFTILGVGFKKHICVFSKGRVMNWYYQVSGIDAVARHMLERTKEPGYNNHLRKKWEEKANRLQKVLCKLSTIDLKKKTDKGLQNLYEDLLIRLEEESALGTLSDFLSSDLIKQTLEKELIAIGTSRKDLSDMLGVISTSTYLSPYAEEQQELLRLAAQYLKKENINRKLESHAVKYWYLQNDYKFSTKLTSAYFKKSIIELLNDDVNPSQELASRKAKHRTLISIKKRLVAKARLCNDKYFAKLVEMVDIHGHLWDLKKIMMQQAFYYFDAIFHEMARRFNIRFEDLKWLMPSEVKSIFLSHQDRQLKEEIRRRQELCILEVTINGAVVTSGTKAKQAQEKIEGRLDIGIKEIFGRVGHPGKVKGRVKILIDPHSKVSFAKDSILVTGMTTPDFMPHLKKVKAIITDEGGITCHAAIISRELGIPCIIGTRSATQTLKDGDFIEVDANRGVAKLLKRAKNS
jgi:phosphohistidine swiveling domain-containing protein